MKHLRNKIILGEETLFLKTAFPRSVVEAAEEQDDLDAGDTAPGRVALHRYDVEAADVQDVSDDTSTEDPAP